MPSRQVASPNTAESAVAVVPSDTVSQPVPFRALYIGNTGNVNVVFSDGSTYTFAGVPAGIFAVGGVRVNATGTTATSIAALY